MDPEILGRRIRAARELAGYRSADALAAAINSAGYGVKTLRAIEQGKRKADDGELWVIARTCGIPIEFFTVGDPLLLTGDAIRLAELERLSQRISERVDQILELNQESFAVLLEREVATEAQESQKRAPRTEGSGRSAGGRGSQGQAR